MSGRGEMDDKAIVKQIAEGVMGWREILDWNDPSWKAYEQPVVLFQFFSPLATVQVHENGDFIPSRDWNPLESIADVFEMQDALTASGRFTRYARQIVRDLQAETMGALEDDEDLYAALLQVTARQRSEAAIAMMEVKA